MRISFLTGCLILAIVSPGPRALAGFASSVTGNGILVSPPASVVPGADTNSDYVVFNESSGVLKSAVTLDESGADTGGHDGLSTFVPVTLAAGSPYSTTLIQLDPGQEGRVNSGAAVIHFSSQILGIALRGTTLDATDIYGHPGTTYPTGYAPAFPNDRGIDFTQDDKFTIAGSGKSLTVNFDAGNLGFDQIRVFTASTPEPTSLVVWSAIGGAILIGMRRSGRRTTS